MPFDVKWYDDQHSIIEVHVHGVGTWEEYHAAVEKISEHLAVAQHRVDVVFNSETGMPAGNPLPHLKAAFKKFSSYQTFGMTVPAGERGGRGASTFTRSIVEVVSKITNTTDQIDGKVFKTIDEAVAYIQADRAKTAVPPTTSSS